MKTSTRARPSGLQIIVHITSQMLELWDGNFLIKVYSVSTAKRGIGNASGSWQTPLGQHRIYKKIGYNLRPGQVIFRQRPYSFVTNIITVKPAIPTIEFITTRVMWLEGLQAGTNRGNGVDSRARLIYIHGTNLEYNIGSPASKGCIMMKNDDIIELFDLVPEDTPVEIEE